MSPINASPLIVTDLNMGKQIGRLKNCVYQVPPILNMGWNFDVYLISRKIGRGYRIMKTTVGNTNLSTYSFNSNLREFIMDN